MKTKLNSYRLRLLRARLALKIFPCNCGKIVANRREFVFETPKLECRFILRDKTKRDGISWEEMIVILDTFLGRQATDQEWRQILAWKNALEKDAA